MIFYFDVFSDWQRVLRRLPATSNTPTWEGAGLRHLDKPSCSSQQKNSNDQTGQGNGGAGLQHLVKPSEPVMMGTSADLPPATNQTAYGWSRHRRKAERKIRVTRQRQ